MSVDWATVSASGLASFVEFVEALTIVLAVGVVRGWKSALSGAVAAGIALLLLILILGPHINGLSLPIFQIIVGTLLMLFGLRWLRKAILRTAGVIPMNDEAKRFARKSATLQSGMADNTAVDKAHFDFGAAVASFNGVFIEGLEVVFIVLAVGGSGGRDHLQQAVLGAGVAAILVILLGLIARHPLTRIPENALKFAVGVLVSAFGTFWAGEGMHIAWPGGEYALLILSVAYLVLAGLAIAVARAASHSKGVVEVKP